MCNKRAVFLSLGGIPELKLSEWPYCSAHEQPRWSRPKIAEWAAPNGQTRLPFECRPNEPVWRQFAATKRAQIGPEIAVTTSRWASFRPKPH